MDWKWLYNGSSHIIYNFCHIFCDYQIEEYVIVGACGTHGWYKIYLYIMGDTRCTYILWVIQDVLIFYGWYKMYLYIVGDTRCTYILWVIQDVLIYYGWYKMYLYIMGDTRCTYILWVIQHVLIYYGWYNMYLHIMGDTRCTCILWVIQDVLIFYGWYKMYLYIVGNTRCTYILWVIQDVLIFYGWYKMYLYIMGNTKCNYIFMVGKYERDKSLDRPRHTWDKNIKVDRIEIHRGMSNYFIWLSTGTSVMIFYTLLFQIQCWTIRIIQPTRCNIFTSLLLDIYVWLNMFRASPRPSSGAYNCTRSLWFYRWKEAAGALLVVVWQVPARPRPTTLQPLLIIMGG